MDGELDVHGLLQIVAYLLQNLHDRQLCLLALPLPLTAVLFKTSGADKRREGPWPSEVDVQ